MMKSNALSIIPQLFQHKAGVNQTECVAPSIFESKMAMVPAGESVLVDSPINNPDAQVGEKHRVYVESFQIDRFAVTNEEFAEFVNGGGYSNMKLWPREIWPHVLQFVDQTGKPGPRFWEAGAPGKSVLRHPVVGVCWFEANAFAQWSGKRLPTSSQWQRAGTWASEDQDLYPWPGGFQVDKANIWISGIHSTVEVDKFNEGSTANGVCQLIGNVWEWVASKFAVGYTKQTEKVNSNLAEIRGGAFDTYLETQANCLFRSGKPFLFRGSNVGFRCCKEQH